MQPRRYAAIASVALLSTSLFAGAWLDRSRTATVLEAGVRFSPISGTFEHPRRNFRLRGVQALDPVDAARIYDLVGGTLAHGYARSGDPAAQAYRGWKRYNTAPFPSKTHGNRYLNIYANRTARRYGKLARAGTLAVGSIVAADSFSLVASGEIVLGPLFIMEKMPEGFNEASGDWRYGYIQPDGKPFGKTKGAHAARVAYCISCHLAVEKQDHLYFPPKRYRETQRNE